MWYGAIWYSIWRCSNQVSIVSAGKIYNKWIPQKFLIMQTATFAQLIQMENESRTRIKSTMVCCQNYISAVMWKLICKWCRLTCGPQKLISGPHFFYIQDQTPAYAMYTHYAKLAFTKRICCWNVTWTRAFQHHLVLSLFRVSQQISWPHSLQVIVQPAFVPRLLRVSMWDKLLHFFWLLELALCFCGCPLLEAALTGRTAMGSAGTAVMFDFLSGSCTPFLKASHSDKAMSCSSFVSLSSSFSWRRASCSW